MGNAAAKAFVAEPVGNGTLTGKLGKCISPTFVSKAPTKLVMKSEMISKKSTIVDQETGEELFTAQSSMGLMSLTLTVKDMNGSIVCVAVGKDGLSSASLRVMRTAPTYPGQGAATETCEEGALYPFSKLEITKSMTKAMTGKYLFTKGDESGESTLFPLYDVTKLFDMMFMLKVENQDGTLVAKAAPPHWSSTNEVHAECGAGVDMVAIAILIAGIGAASGSSGAAAAGGLAGAGVI